MTNPEVLPTPGPDPWDWRAALAAHPIGRYGGLTWLAEMTSTKRRTVYSYSAGQVSPPPAWLDRARSVLTGPWIEGDRVG